MIERALCQAEHLCADADTPFVQRLDRDLVPLTDVAQDVLVTDSHTVQNQLDRRGRANAEFVFLLANREPINTALNQKRGYPAVASFRIRIRENDEEARFATVRNPQFPAIQHPAIAITSRAGLQRKCIRSRTSFG